MCSSGSRHMTAFFSLLFAHWKSMVSEEADIYIYKTYVTLFTIDNNDVSRNFFQIGGVLLRISGSTTREDTVRVFMQCTALDCFTPIPCLTATQPVSPLFAGGGILLRCMSWGTQNWKDPPALHHVDPRVIETEEVLVIRRRPRMARRPRLCRPFHDGAVRDPQGVLRGMGRFDKGIPLIRKPHDLFEKPELISVVEAARRLVHDERPRPLG